MAICCNGTTNGKKAITDPLSPNVKIQNLLTFPLPDQLGFDVYHSWGLKG